MSLVDEMCAPCEGGVLPLFRTKAEELLKEVPGWSLSVDGKKLERVFKFKNFVEAMAFANTLTPLAEKEKHHPDLEIGWGKVRIELSTHAIGGLSINDFILAAKINQL